MQQTHKTICDMIRTSRNLDELRRSWDLAKEFLDLLQPTQEAVDMVKKFGELCDIKLYCLNNQG